MQIATLNYQYDSKENLNNNDARGRQQHRHVLTSIVQSNKKLKPRQSLLSDPSLSSTVPLPPIPSHQKRPSSIRIKGNSLTAAKSSEVSPYAFHPNRSRSRSRQSDHSDTGGSVRSRSVSPAAALRPTSRFVRLKFGHPVKLRSAEFYNTESNEVEIRAREASFINDSIRSAHQSRRQSIIPPYEALTDPHLRRFFQSPVVLDVVRKNINVEQSYSYKSDERTSQTSKGKRRSKTQDPNDYRRIVTKGSSGYGRLNGYDCIPLSSPARNPAGSTRNSVLDGSTSNLAVHRSSTDSYYRRSTNRDKTQASADTSVNSFPTRSSYQADSYEKKKTLRKYDRFKPPKPIATSSPLRNPLRQLTEEANPLVSQRSTTDQTDKTNNEEVNHGETVDNNVAQD